MKFVVLIGLDPATVDFSDPALPPGMTAEKIHAGVKLALADFAARVFEEVVNAVHRLTHENVVCF